ncbi:MAG: hypothetical protein K6F17_01350 [Lachnospiraceae bacterium]|nr:hypothetical protein [Lachnospiraceae bacterium]
MTQNFLQFLNVGFGIISNNEQVDSWDKDAAMEKALAMNVPGNDVRIIGFRFYTMEDNVITSKSGVFYLEGELFTYPKVDADVNAFIKTRNAVFEVGQELIKITDPYVMVYKFNPGDEILDTGNVVAKMKINKEKERMAKLQEEVVAYKARLIKALKDVEEAIDTNQFNAVILAEVEDTSVKALDILNDGGDFSKHIEHLRNIRVEIMKIDKFIKDTQSGNV